MVGSYVWAYVLGAVCSLVQTLGAEQAKWNQKMDHVNFFMAEGRFTKDFRKRACGACSLACLPVAPTGICGGAEDPPQHTITKGAWLLRAQAEDGRRLH